MGLKVLLPVLIIGIPILLRLITQLLKRPRYRKLVVEEKEPSKKGLLFPAVLTAAILFFIGAVIGIFLAVRPFGGEKAEHRNLPVSGDQIAVITLKGKGEIRIKLLAEESPNAVKAFQTAAKSGELSGRVLQKGILSVTPEGMPALSGLEKNNGVRHLSGSVSISPTGEIYLLGKLPSVSYMELADFVQQAGSEGEQEYTAQDTQDYQEYGGSPSFDLRYTVIGTIYEGVRLIDSLSSDSGKTVEIEAVEFMSYP